MNELHDLAKKQGWSIDDIPEWGNNSLYLTTMLIQAEAMFGATQRQDLKRACTLNWSGIGESNS